ncbi:YbaB/EbfC family nucleoid-associated protein [Actinomadura alba]|uniref:YbaB/EbfC family nucleoid-associated protein n=1 Tax=Actinomadura alba TaxID=406431 RepID=A0ABR7LNN5_9ACTN|nr:YbaB/EbfC family nucleoid-associated protein [Actinomadura alba]MBC6466350.1 YbaB/EbfC family nucleoid-associated protein [Actinomadura alba]
MSFDVQRAIEQMSEQASKLSTDLQNLSAKGSDDRKYVTVTCGMGGRLIDIEFDPMARRLDTHDLRESILIASERATTAVQEQFANETSKLAGLANGLDSEAIQEAQKQVSKFQKLIEEQMSEVAKIRSSIPRTRQ